MLLEASASLTLSYSSGYHNSSSLGSSDRGIYVVACSLNNFCNRDRRGKKKPTAAAFIPLYCVPLHPLYPLSPYHLYLNSYLPWGLSPPPYPLFPTTSSSTQKSRTSTSFLTFKPYMSILSMLKYRVQNS